MIFVSSIRNTVRHSLPALFLLALPFVLSAQRSRAADDAAGCLACGMVMALPVIAVAVFVLNIVMLVWVARDAKARGMDNAVVWMLFVFFASVLGLIVYLFSRPAGNKVRCHNCGNQRLQASTRCPHCASA